MPPRSPSEQPERPGHHFGGVRPTSALRLVLFLVLTLGAIWLLMRHAAS